jgi:hypothetical protein
MAARIQALVALRRIISRQPPADAPRLGRGQTLLGLPFAGLAAAELGHPALVEHADQVTQGGQGVVVLIDGNLTAAVHRIVAVTVQPRLVQQVGAGPPHHPQGALPQPGRHRGYPRPQPVPFLGEEGLTTAHLIQPVKFPLASAIVRRRSIR